MLNEEKKKEKKLASTRNNSILLVTSVFYVYIFISYTNWSYYRWIKNSVMVTQGI